MFWRINDLLSEFGVGVGAMVAAGSSTNPILEPPFLREAQPAGLLRHHPRSLETRAGHLLRRV